MLRRPGWAPTAAHEQRLFSPPPWETALWIRSRGHEITSAGHQPEKRTTELSGVAVVRETVKKETFVSVCVYTHVYVSCADSDLDIWPTCLLTPLRRLGPVSTDILQCVIGPAAWPWAVGTLLSWYWLAGFGLNQPLSALKTQ